MGEQGEGPGTVQPAGDALKSHIPRSARVWNYLLGGKDNFEADRQAAEHSISVKPDMLEQARADRAFLGRAVRHLVAEGIRQFLDIGTGLPTADNTHQVAQRAAPECRIVYVDHDPLVLVHARALLTSSPEGECHYIDADLYEPDEILAQARNLLDFTQPIAVMLVGILHHVEGVEESHAIVHRLMSAMPSGSRLVINHPTSVVHGERSEQSARKWNESGGRPTVTLRTPDEIAAYFDGLDIEEPGVVSCSRWRPVPEIREPVVDAFGAVGRKP
ncbi:SAM-dependent methyltransferase [Actinomadura sp. BRA 177]|uniref:SAM-dependent methyltransferase n=1 Tax=Actinomadura sp. BRA 177 TaxID=2745202 RepID=UPI00159590BE|nr:SAM-dependent methyltransferase [Actinomadura sp. BRA 177]NVI88571.1 SAM-dependent methyltransferase [Actinomadura sp. BRA 177]